MAGALLVVPVAFLARRWYGERAGLAAALVAAASPALLESLGDRAAAGVFGRQVPRGASPEEAFLAKVNYAGRPRRLTARDLGRAFGPGTTPFSSAFGAIRRAVWEALPFPGIVMSEDQAWALAALRAGHEIRYSPALPIGSPYSRSRARPGSVPALR